MGFPSDQLTKWVALQFADITEAGAAKRFELYHAVEDASPERLHIFERKDDEDAGTLAQRIWDVAEMDAQNRLGGTPQRYVVAMWRADAEEFDSQTAFILHARSPGLLGVNTDPPTDKGLVGQSQRHLENILQLALVTIRENQTQAERKNRDQAERLERYESRMMQMLDREQELMDRSTERKIAEAREIQAARRHDQLMGMVMTVGGAMMAQFMGGKGALTAAGTLRDDAIGKFLKGLSEDEAMKIFGVLPPNKQLELAELYKSYAEEDRKKQEDLPDVLKDKPAEEAH